MNTINCNEYRIDEDPKHFGTRISLKSKWHSDYLPICSKYKVKVILLSEHFGWRDSDISFLSDLPFLEGVNIINDNVTDVRPIETLANLKMLGLACKAKTSLDLSSLNNLKDLFLIWRNAYHSVFLTTTLVRLNIVGYPNHDLTGWRSNSLLHELLLSSSKLEKLSGIESFPNVSRLDLFRCAQLTSLKELSSCSAINTLAFCKCSGIRDLQPLSGLRELRELAVEDCGTIETLAPLSKCRELTSLQIAGNTTVIDGNFNTLLSLKHLKRVLIANKKHYTHTAEELKRKQ